MHYIQIRSPWHRLLLFVGLVLLFSLFTALTGLLIGKLYFDVSLAQLAEMVTHPQSSQDIAFIRFYQLFNQIGVFFLPVFGLMFFTSGNVWSSLKLDKSPYAVAVVITILIVYASLPFNGFLTSLNESMSLPKSLAGIEQWMKDKELQANLMIEAILTTKSVSVLMLNMFIVALIPALGEELFFRGVLLKLFREITRNIHWAVIVSAILFSAIHMQFYGFLPRLMMGIILGYLYVFTQNLWVPIIMHFVNNASSVLLFYLHENGIIGVPMDKFGTTDNVVYIIGSGMMVVWLMIMLYQRLGVDRVIKKF